MTWGQEKGTPVWRWGGSLCLVVCREHARAPSRPTRQPVHQELAGHMAGHKGRGFQLPTLGGCAFPSGLCCPPVGSACPSPHRVTPAHKGGPATATLLTSRPPLVLAAGESAELCPGPSSSRTLKAS